jgi:hypothetical protein
MTAEQKLINRHKRLQNLLDVSEDILYQHFLNKHKLQIEQAKDIVSIKAIKEQLRIMPDTASKVLIFKLILGKEKEINKDK